MPDQTANPSLQPVRISMAGAGSMAREHLRAFAGIDGVEISGICSRTRRRAEALAQEFGISEVADSIDELWDATEADLLVVAVSELSTLGVCQKAFAYDWSCLIEKPVGHDLAEARQLVAMARETETVAMAGLNRRHYHSTQVVLDDLEGRDGPRLIQILDQEAPAAASAAGRPDAVVENWMYANSIHIIDYARVLGRGSVQTVNVEVPWAGLGTKVVAASVYFDSGDVAMYQAVWDMPGPWGVVVTTPEVRWELRPLEKAGLQKAGTRSIEWVPADPRDEDFKPGFRTQAQETIGKVRGQTSRVASIEDALLTMELIGQIYGR